MLHPPTPLIKGDYSAGFVMKKRMTISNENKTPCNSVYSVVQNKNINHLKIKAMPNKDLWSKILNIVITVLTAIATTFGVTSCM